MFRFAASSTPSNLTQTVIRLGAVAAACSALTWSLQGCGGGSRAKNYQPDSVVSFGDENSAMVDSTTLDSSSASTGSVPRKIQGLVYSVNPIASVTAYCTNQTPDAYCANPITEPVTNYVKSSGSTTRGYYFTAVQGVKIDNVVDFLDLGTGIYQTGGSSAVALKRDVQTAYLCSRSTLWNQIVAHSFGKGFGDACAADNDGAKTYAAYGAKIADLQTQVAAHRAELREGVLVTIMVGQHDMLWLHDEVKAQRMTAIQARQELSRRVAILVNIVKDVLSTGAKVVLAYPPDLSKAPLASQSGIDKDLLALFMDDRSVGGSLGFVPTWVRSAPSDGRRLAFVETNNLTTIISPSYVYGPKRLCDAASTYVRPDGTTETLLSDKSNAYTLVKYCTVNNFVNSGTETGSVSTYIWADDIHFAPAGHSLVGTQAASRAFNQF
jgi:outer membrane lipase/esterase